MSIIKAIVADDERPVRDELVRMLARLWPELEIVAVADNGTQAAALLRGLAPDVAFLDIRMPMQSGIEVAELAGTGCQVVFVTAYEDFAVQAFAQGVTDYLLKPVEEQRLRQTIERLKAALGQAEQSSDRNLPDQTKAATPVPVPGSAPLRWLRVSDGDAVVVLSTDDVVYFRAGDKYTTVVATEKSYLIRKPISELHQELDDDFWRINRGIIVNVKQISHVRKSANGCRLITLKGVEETLTSSRSYRHLFEQM